MIEDLDYSELAPGIRRTVEYLRRLGFKTTDSGDGVTHHPDDPDAIEQPHVVIATAPEDLVTQSTRLHSILVKRGITVVPYGVSEYLGVEPVPGVNTVEIQGTFDPALESSGLIILVGLDDKMLEATGGFSSGAAN